MLRVKLVEQLHEKPMTTTALELRTDGYIDLSREALVLSPELLNQVFVQ
jgi:hypothetical protein